MFHSKWIISKTSRNISFFNNAPIKRINTNYNRCQVVGTALNSKVPSSNPGSGQNASLSAPQSLYTLNLVTTASFHALSYATFTK